MKSRGFSTIEILTSLALFGFVAVYVLSAFRQGVAIQRWNADVQETLTTMRIALERIGRVTRVGIFRDPQNGVTDDSPVGCSGFAFAVVKHHEFDTVCYKFEGGKLVQRIVKSGAPQPDEDLSAGPSVRKAAVVTGVTFEKRGFARCFPLSTPTGDPSCVPGASDSVQPSVTIIVKIQPRPFGNSPGSPIYLQTTLSQRCLETAPDCMATTQDPPAS